MTGSRRIWSAPIRTAPLDATVNVPGSKSLTNRALLLAALSREATELTGALVSRDSDLMLAALAELGVGFSTPRPGVLRLEPPNELRAQTGVIHCGLAGTVMRFVPLLAALVPGDLRFEGDSGALVRPMGPIIQAVRDLGVAVTEHGEPGFLPFTVHGRGRDRWQSRGEGAGTPAMLAAPEIVVDGAGSSQFVSAPLLVGANLPAGLIVRLRGQAPSLPHIEMTVVALQERGVHVETLRSSTGTPQGWRVYPGAPRGGAVTIEPDLSNAGPFLAAALIAGGEVRIPNWPAQTTQAGAAWRRILPLLGGQVSRSEDGVFTVTGTGNIKGAELDLGQVGELTPTVAALAALAQTPSRLTGIAHLRGHETDRLAALATEINRLGGWARELTDGLEIHPSPLRGATLQSYADHRMATFGAILGLRIPGVEVVDIATTAKTLPDFPQMWAQLAAGEKVIGEAAPPASGAGR